MKSVSLSAPNLIRGPSAAGQLSGGRAAVPRMWDEGLRTCSKQVLSTRQLGNKAWHNPSRWDTAGLSFPVLYVERVFLTLSSSNAFKAVRAQKLLLPPVGGRQILKAAADHDDKMDIHYSSSCVLVSVVQTHRHNLNSEIKISTQEPDNKLNYRM